MTTGQLSEDPQPAAARATGRPATIDPDAVARIALRLFAERGYEQTSMEDIAGAAGIGRKSLYRYFASKADLVWGGIEPVAEAAGRALDGARDGALEGTDDDAPMARPPARLPTLPSADSGQVWALRRSGRRRSGRG